MALPALHERLGSLEQLVCAADGNAARRGEIAWTKQRHLFTNSRYATWELQEVIRHVLEYVFLLHGYSSKASVKFHADCHDRCVAEFIEYMPDVDKFCGGIDAGAPATLQPPPAPAAASKAEIALGELREIAAAYRRGDLDIVAEFRAIEEGLKTADLGPLDRVRRLLQQSESSDTNLPEPDQPGLFDTANTGQVPRPSDGNGAAGNAGGNRPNGAGHGGDEVVS